MELSGIQQFLQIYRDRLFREDDKRKEFLLIIKKVSGLTINEKDVSFSRGIMSIKGNAVIKNELFMHKKRILEEMNNIGRTEVFDIQ